MKQVKVPFTVLSKFKCWCGKQIKQNLVSRKPNRKHFLCFKHFKQEEFIRRNKIRQGRRIGEWCKSHKMPHWLS